MAFDFHNPADLVVIVATFALVLTVWLMGVLIWSKRRSSQKQQVQGRLGTAAQDDDNAKVLRLWKGTEEATVAVPRPQSSTTARMEQMCIQAGWTASAKSLLLGVVGATILIFAIVLVVTRSPLAATAVSAVVLVTARQIVMGRISRRSALFDTQLVEALELAARSLRAGHSLTGAFFMVSQEMSAPISTVFTELCQLQALGLSLEESITRTANKYGSSDMKLFATSVVIQVRSGGNLADMMERLAFVIRDRMRLKRRIRILTAQTQLSKRVLTVLPFGLLALLTTLKPDYMGPLFSTPMGRNLLVVSLAGIFAGMWAMNRLSTLRY